MGSGRKVIERKRDIPDSFPAMKLRPLLIRCPNTNRLIDTGVATDPRTYETGTFSNNTTGCPHCGQPHTWSKENSLLGDDPELRHRN